MATTSITIPPMNKISLIGIWMETVLYGSNCVVYGLCMYVLLRNGRSISRQWVLILTSTILFMLCTAHISASLCQLLEAFIYVPADIPDYSTLYWLNVGTPMGVLKTTLYGTLDLLQDIVLIWRLYVVFNRNWKVVLLPVLVEAAHMSAAYGATVIYSTDPTIVVLRHSIATRLGLTGWVLDIIVNLSITLAIATRLWWLGHTAASFNASRPVENRYLTTAYIIIESGCIFASATIVVVALYVSYSPLTLAGLDVASQLAVLVPLLIVVRVGLGHDVQRQHTTISLPKTPVLRTPRSDPHMRVLVTREMDDQMELKSTSIDQHLFAKNMHLS